ncbi:MAG: tripartite tricarboxylate transporter permease [Verrucomicrobiota bacterium]
MPFADILQPSVIVPWILAMAFGHFVGATPGLTATMGVALIVPLTFYMGDPVAGLAMIIGVSFTAIFAGDIPATYLRIPGTPASAAATLDGHQLARQGKAGLALYLDLFCSCLGGLIGVALLIVLAPQLAKFALKFSNFEYFWLAVFGLSMSAVVSVGATWKGLLAAALGVLLATVGIDVVSGVPRFTFNNVELTSGLSFIPAMIGLFGLSEVLRSLARPGEIKQTEIEHQEKTRSIQTLLVIWRHKWLVLRSSLLGTFIGALPGAGADIAAWAAYGIAQRTSKQAGQFGKGSIEGVIAPTSANNAAVGGAWIPALVFGIPGDSVTAIVLGALIMYNIKPGPLLFEQNAGQVQAIFWIALLTQLFLIPSGYLMIKAFAWIMRVPRSLIMTGVVLFSVVGAFGLKNSLFDVWVMIAFGLLGFFLESQKVPLPPLILGLILGPMLEEHLRTGLIKTSGSFLPFLTRPICAVLVTLLALVFAAPIISRWRQWRASSKSA